MSEYVKKKQINARIPIAHWIALQTHLTHPLKGYVERGSLESFITRAIGNELARQGVEIPQLKEGAVDATL